MRKGRVDRVTVMVNADGVVVQVGFMLVVENST